MIVDDIALTLQRGIGTKGIIHLLCEMGSADAVYAASEQELVAQVGLREDIARDIVRRTSHSQAQSELRFVERNALSVLSSTSVDYPELLLESPDYPHVLYVKGSVEALHGRMISVVGTRAITPYGQRMCDVLIGRLAEIEPNAVIVSGLAYGVDAAAHRAALKYGLKTVAVIANPLPDVVPVQHRALSEEIVAAGGAIITELHSQTKQNGSYFIPRNRIIAGLSEGIIVVESPYEGGSLVTAELADGYNRVVMAVPGRVGDRCSDGTNRLIKRRQAAMVCVGDDVVRELGWDITTPGNIPERKRDIPVLSADEKRIMECFGEGEALDMDGMIARSRVPAGQLAALLLGLELSGIVRALPGRIYESTGLWIK